MSNEQELHNEMQDAAQNNEMLDEAQNEAQNEVYEEIDIQEPQAQPEPTPKRRSSARKALALVLIVALCAGAGFGGGLAAIKLSGYNIQGDEIVINPNDEINTAEAIAAKVLPSVVGISTSSKVLYQGWSGQEEGLTYGVGTGIIIDEAGYIITNSHVVNDGDVETISVGLSDGRELTGTVLWNDRSIDLAIVKIEAEGLTAADLGDSDEVNIGAYAVAIGNPLGLDFERSVTVGVISGLNRTITTSDGQNEITMGNLIQTDAAINSGNSGGPLLNAEGQVIGINSAKAQNGEGLGFAIPINTAIPIIESILESGSFQRVYLGIQGGSVEEYIAMYPEQEVGTDKGVIVTGFLKNSPAKSAGMKQGDVIVGVEGELIENMTDLISTLLKYNVGDQVEVKVVRGQKTETFNVTLSAASE